MSISNYAELKTALASWLHRSSISTQAADCITLAEARLNRELGEVLATQSFPGTVGSRTIDVSTYSIARPIALFLLDTDGMERELSPRMVGAFPYSTTNAKPKMWGILGDNLTFDCPLDQAYTFRLHFRQRFALSDSATTNWLLENHPDIYLAAAIVWGALFTEDDAKAGKWAVLLEQGIPSIKAYISAQSPGLLTVDPGLTDIGHRGFFDYTTGT